MDKMRDVLVRRIPGQVGGRDREISRLLGILNDEGPSVAFVHGIPGIGKTALLANLASVARASVEEVVEFDGRSIKPTERGILRALADALELENAVLDDLVRRLSAVDGPVLLQIDTYERLRLLDSWIRRTFVPSLPRSVRLVLASRYPPPSPWLIDPGWRDLVLDLSLGPLDEAASAELLEHLGVEPNRARELRSVARGHPLALALGATTNAGLGRRTGGLQEVLQELTRRFLEEVENDTTREALVAVSVVRRVTASLLADLVPGEDPRDLQERLRSLPFVQSRPDGLVVHDAVRTAIAASTRADRPERYRACRRAAWRHLRSEVREAGDSELWRYTADMLYLIENPIVREAFFPTGAGELSVEPAAAEDRDTVLDIVTRHEGPEETDLLRYWWRIRSDHFRVVTDARDRVVGFYLMMPADRARGAPQDPLVDGWLDHLRQADREGRRTLFIRRWLALEDGESPSPVQAACWLDIKRTYMELRPELRRVYLTVRELGPYADVATELGFDPAPDLDRVLDGTTYRTAWLDFGPGSVDGWLERLVGAELGVDGGTELVDHHSRELLLDSGRVGLSPREYGVVSLLEQRAGAAVPRRELLRRVWEGEEVASNVVDSVVYGLRQKMEDEAHRLETVRGVGYRLREG